ncbi:gliding motility lipoprotein GldD [Winogradskyella sp.]|uniref:gliding motility lipoprotein GldD n=1 Tax=Winogradskyella sp. TaxID=1883156 RepID=UPI0025EA83D2|nr:gliding motility lipoprotein GldD [Winogradskyella sp.]
MKRLVLPLLSFFMLGCGDDPLPKPKAYLRLEYPEAKYKNASIPLPFSFEKNKLAESIDSVKTSHNSIGIDIKYPSLKATIFLTYKKIEDDNLNNLLRDAQNLTQEHTIKADEISYDQFENTEKDVYGMLYQIGGNAASQSQFYVTDSINHFVRGSLYFNVKPNYDSIYPASEYLKKDIKRIMETIRWKN